MVKFTLLKKILQDFGGYFPISENRTFIFKLIVNKDTFLPFSLLQANDTDEETNKTTFTRIEANTEMPIEESWYYSTYLGEYTLTTEKKELPLLPVGMEAPVFELPLFKSERIVKSGGYKNKVLLIEFWIRNCGPCIASVPKLNTLQEKFRSKGLEILAVNVHDEEPAITYFVNKYSPLYPIVCKGENLAKQFGVSSFPVAYVINRKGTIVYSGGFDYDVITRVIENEL